MKIGDKVKMVNCVEAHYHHGKIWTVRSEPQIQCGVKVVWLEGYSGSFDVNFLEVQSNTFVKENLK